MDLVHLYLVIRAFYRRLTGCPKRLLRHEAGEIQPHLSGGDHQTLELG